MKVHFFKNTPGTLDNRTLIRTSKIELNDDQINKILLTFCPAGTLKTIKKGWLGETHKARSVWTPDGELSYFAIKY